MTGLSNAGSCVAFANMAAIETCFKKKTGVFGEFSDKQNSNYHCQLQVTTLSSSWWIVATRRTVQVYSFSLISHMFKRFSHISSCTTINREMMTLCRCKRLQRSLLLLLHQDHC